MTRGANQSSYSDNGPLPARPISLPTSPQDDYTRSIPWKTLLPLLLFRMTDGIGYLFIFPFITDMITSFRVEPGKIGLYAGIAEGSLMVVEAIMSPVWAKLANRYQRRHLMIFGLLISTLPVILIGFSTKVWHVVLARAVSEFQSPHIALNEKELTRLSGRKFGGSAKSNNRNRNIQSRESFERLCHLLPDICARRYDRYLSRRRVGSSIRETTDMARWP